jgi:hypothetical protein
MPDDDGPYFARDDTLDLIQKVATEESLVIYVGAGVSIDRTGMQWEHLISKLMATKVDNEELRKRLLSESPLQSASIAKQLFINEAKNPESANIQISHEVQSCLYNGDWRRSDIARSIMLLVAELKARGTDVHVITTNYDDCLEQELQLINGKRRQQNEDPIELTWCVPNHVPFEQLDQEVERVVSDKHIIHLHGYVPEPAGQPTPITLSEVDYAKSYPLSSKILEELFHDSAVLILGSSLTDPPLLNALGATRDSATHPRFAVLPVQGFNLPATLHQDIKENVDARMSHFMVDVTFPDFFSEVAQFVTEVRLCAKRRPANVPFRRSRHCPSSRLGHWWTTWTKNRKGNWAAANEKDHKRLKECQALLAEKLPKIVKNTEVEIWVRWKPDKASTRLRLWASSKDKWPDVDARTAKVGNGADYLVSVRTFTLGRVEFYPPDDEAEQRRRRYVCVPIKAGETQQSELLTAVIAFAYRLDSGDPTKDLAVLHRMNIVEQLEIYGRRIIDG